MASKKKGRRLYNWTVGLMTTSFTGTVALTLSGNTVCNGSCPHGCGFGCVGLTAVGLFMAVMQLKKKSCNASDSLEKSKSDLREPVEKYSNLST